MSTSILAESIECDAVITGRPPRTSLGFICAIREQPSVRSVGVRNPDFRPFAVAIARERDLRALVRERRVLFVAGRDPKRFGRAPFLELQQIDVEPAPHEGESGSSRRYGGGE